MCLNTTLYQRKFLLHLYIFCYALRRHFKIHLMNHNSRLSHNNWIFRELFHWWSPFFWRYKAYRSPLLPGIEKSTGNITEIHNPHIQGRYQSWMIQEQYRTFHMSCGVFMISLCYVFPSRTTVLYQQMDKLPASAVLLITLSHVSWINRLHCEWLVATWFSPWISTYVTIQICI